MQGWTVLFCLLIQKCINLSPLKRLDQTISTYNKQYDTLRSSTHLRSSDFAPEEWGSSSHPSACYLGGGGRFPWCPLLKWTTAVQSKAYQLCYPCLHTSCPTSNQPVCASRQASFLIKVKFLFCSQRNSYNTIQQSFFRFTVADKHLNTFCLTLGKAVTSILNLRIAVSLRSNACILLIFLFMPCK